MSLPQTALDTVCYNTYREMCAAAAQEIAQDLRRNPRQLLCIAAGHTSLGVFEALIGLHRNGEADFSAASFVSMDEWLGMNAATPDGCGDFLMRNFLCHVNYRPENIFLWDTVTNTPEAECARVRAFLAHHSLQNKIDYLLLGCGMNGHLALNEPGTALDSRAHAAVLDPVTVRVGQKYFQNGAALSGGITLGLADFAEAAQSVLMINGAKKREILHRLLGSTDFDPALPATALHRFAHASLRFDKEALDGFEAV